MYAYIQNKAGKFCVCWWDPTGRWELESEWDTQGQAQAQVSYLNGGLPPHLVDQLGKLLASVQIKVDFMTLLKDRNGH